MSQHRISSDGEENPAIVLVGNPNVGKSVVFSCLTGRYAWVSNYPGTTVEVTRGRLLHDGSREVVDTPGINSLHPQSLDERVTRDILLSTPGRRVLQVADAKNLRRALTITTQLAEMGVPVVLDLNLMDEAKRRGITVSAAELSRRIGIPVVETVATEKIGVKSLQKALETPPVVPEIRVEYPPEIEDAVSRIARILPSLRIDHRGAALTILSDPEEARSIVGDGSDTAAADEAARIAAETQAKFSNPLAYIIGVSRSKVVDGLLEAVYAKNGLAGGAGAEGRVRVRCLGVAAAFAAAAAVLYPVAGRTALGEWGLHPLLLHLLGLFLFFSVVPVKTVAKITTHHVLGIVFLAEVLYLTYLFVGVFGAGTLVNLVENGFFNRFVVPPLKGWLDRSVPVAFVNDLLVGEFGLVSMGLTYAIAIVLPIVLTFFIAFGILEDSGYLPRLSVIADRAMRRMGLNGKAVLPMVLGLGCDTMATLTTRILESKKERTIATLLLALAVPCSAQLGVVMAMAAGSSLAVAFTVFGVVTLQLFVVGSAADRLIKGRATDFIIEIPPLRVPLAGNIWLKTLHRVSWFLKEAVPLFLIGTLALFVLDRAGGIGVLERVARPVIQGLLGLPVESTVAFIVGFFRRDYGAAGLYDLFTQGRLTNNQVAVSMVVITLFIPCIAHFFVMIKERGLRTAFAIAGFVLLFAILVGALLNGFLRVTGIEL
ncbi:MAG: small GTP-binding protein domain protein [Candidatus Krumholzibacteriota bacterium]|nr:small GTP-binding protein domain protein [Candidatus Krumholzibacteriota bacterium]